MTCEPQALSSPDLGLGPQLRASDTCVQYIKCAGRKSEEAGCKVFALVLLC